MKYVSSVTFFFFARSTGRHRSLRSEIFCARRTFDNLYGSLSDKKQWTQRRPINHCDEHVIFFFIRIYNIVCPPPPPLYPQVVEFGAERRRRVANHRSGDARACARGRRTALTTPSPLSAISPPRPRRRLTVYTLADRFFSPGSVSLLFSYFFPFFVFFFFLSHLFSDVASAKTERRKLFIL